MALQIMKVLNYGAKKEFVDRYDIQELLRANHLTDEQIVEDILSLIADKSNQFIIYFM